MLRFVLGNVKGHWVSAKVLYFLKEKSITVRHMSNDDLEDDVLTFCRVKIGNFLVGFLTLRTKKEGLDWVNNQVVISFLGLIILHEHTQAVQRSMVVY